jgi:hypothetical protein
MLERVCIIHRDGTDTADVDARIRSTKGAFGVLRQCLLFARKDDALEKGKRARGEAPQKALVKVKQLPVQVPPHPSNARNSSGCCLWSCKQA